MYKNRTLVYFSPVFTSLLDKSIGNALAKINGVLAVGIDDEKHLNRKHNSNIYVLYDLKGMRSPHSSEKYMNVRGNTVKSQIGISTLESLGAIQDHYYFSLEKSNLRIFVLDLGNKLQRAPFYFKKGKFSKMFDKKQVEVLKYSYPENKVFRRAIYKSPNQKALFEEYVSEAYGSTVPVTIDSEFDDFRIEPRQEVFNKGSEPLFYSFIEKVKI